MANQSSRDMFDDTSKNWARDEPRLLSDWTARPFLLQWCPSIRDCKVLDLGCGEGYFTRQLARSDKGPAAHMEGIDLSAGMIEFAEANENQAPLNITYSVGCATDFTPRMDSYDLITAVFVYNYTTVEQMHQSMSRVYDHLSPGGHFVYSLPQPVNPFMDTGTDSFHFEGSSGWFSGPDHTFEVQMAQRDGSEVSVRCLHKTFQDVLDGLRSAGFTHFPDFRELAVTEEMIAEDADFFGPLADLPLHMAFRIRK